MRKLSLLLFALFLGMSTSFCQTTSIETLLRDYLSALNKLNKTKEISDVTQYFSTDYTSTRTYIGLRGVPRSEEGNFEDMKRSLYSLISEKDINANLEITKIERIEEGEVFSTISAQLASKSVVDGKEVENNSFQMTLTAKKDATGQLKFVYGITTQKLEKRSVGTCFARFYEREGDFIIELVYPNDFEYIKDLHPFSFRLHKGKRIILSGGEQYAWESDGKILRSSDSNKKDATVVGLAKQKKDAVTAILSSIYRERCNRIVKQ